MAGVEGATIDSRLGVDHRKSESGAMELRIAELRKSAINNRKSSIKDDDNRDCLSAGNGEKPSGSTALVVPHRFLIACSLRV